jgi:hypothetical protein
MAPVDLVIVGRQVLPERTAREGGNVLVQHMRQVIHLALADQADRFENLRRLDLVQRACLIVGAIFRWLPRGCPGIGGCALRFRHHAGSVPRARRTFHSKLQLLRHPAVAQ